MYSKLIIGLLLIVGLAQPALADELIFKNGDRLSGKVNQLVDGKLVFDSNVAGSIKVDLSKIQTFKTDKAVEVHLTEALSSIRSLSSPVREILLSAAVKR
jgi:hypothetical protein